MAIGHDKLRQSRGSAAGDSDGMAAAERALALDPRSAEAHAIKAQILMSGGDPVAAAAEVATALELDPASYEVNRSAGRLNYQMHRHEDAIRHYEKAASLVEADINSASMLMSSYTVLGDLEGMRRSAQRVLERAEAILVHDQNNSMVAGYSAYALAALGEGERAKARMERALLIDPSNFNMRYNFACAISVYLKDKEAALDMLGPVLETISDTFLPYAKVDPDLELLRKEPRYLAMLAKAEARLAAKYRTAGDQRDLIELRRDFFITGTDTGVGKTLVTAALLRTLRESGLAVAGMKPIAAGAIAGPEGPANEDALLLQAESSVRHPYALVNPWLFEPAIAPHIAAAEAGIAIDTARIVQAHARLREGVDVVLAEGAGGFLVPLDASRSCAELPALLGMDVDPGRGPAPRLPESRAPDRGGDRCARPLARRLGRQQRRSRIRASGCQCRNSPRTHRGTLPRHRSMDGKTRCRRRRDSPRLRLALASHPSGRKGKNRVAALAGNPYDSRAVSPRTKGHIRGLR